MTTAKRNATTWRAGTSGNPRGRPRGTGAAAQLRAALADKLPAILERLTVQALAGDVQSARLILERCIPALRPTEAPHPVALPATGKPEEQGRAILSALAAGELGPQTAATLLGAVATLGRLIELAEIEARISALEAAKQ
jgi:hypothetical protein